MKQIRPLRALAIFAVLLTALFTSGCDKMSGKYKDKSGMLSVEFKSGKAYVTNSGMTIEATYDVDGDKVTVRAANGMNIVFTKNSDGTLSGGPLGEKLTKE